jgi:AraC-like DNA-binding protein/mannose-6-phosphate isomerase-like protein (cupin superfamily)
MPIGPIAHLFSYIAFGGSILVSSMDWQNVRCRSVGVVDTAGGWRIEKHTHRDFHEMYFVLDGTIVTEMAGHRHRGSRGEFILVPRDRPHSNRTPRDSSMRIVMVRWSGADDLPARSEPGYHYDALGRLRYLVDWMVDLQPSQGPEEDTTQDALAAAALCEAARLQRDAGGGLVEPVRRYVRNHITESIALDDLAEAASLSKYHFTRRFKRETGQTPMQLVTRMRVEAARHLIMQTDLTMEAVARRAGFSSASYMNQVFRRELDRTPGSLRRRSGA